MSICKDTEGKLKKKQWKMKNIKKKIIKECQQPNTN